MQYFLSKKIISESIRRSEKQNLIFTAIIGSILLATTIATLLRLNITNNENITENECDSGKYQRSMSNTDP